LSLKSKEKKTKIAEYFFLLSLYVKGFLGGFLEPDMQIMSRSKDLDSAPAFLQNKMGFSSLLITDPSVFRVQNHDW
jgi:hypothetical protein